MQPIKYRFGRGTPGNNSPCNTNFASRFLSEGGTLFNFNSNRPTNSVSVENIPDHVNRREILTLFNTLIGEVRSFQDIRDMPNPRLEITFSDQDASAKAMCMNGYTVAGVPLTVSALAMSSRVHRADKQSTDDRRNLYVLGLPFALTKNEFGTLFAEYGTISHCVILATVDNSSRRRGFVVMSSHEEAKCAMAGLTRTQIKGHSIDVSWAVVQRSQGFLDGGDRALLLDSRSQLPSPTPKLFERKCLTSSESSDSSLESHDADPASLTTVSGPTTSLLVTNLPTLLFSQAQDLHPLFFPFGHIEKLEIVQVSPLGTMSVLVQYSHAGVAREAKESLTGQLYGSYRIEARYVKLPMSTPSYSDQPPSSVGAAFDKRPYSPANFLAHSRGLLTQVGAYCDPVAKDAAPIDYFSYASNGPPHEFLANSHSRQSSFSAINPSHSNVFNDFNDSYLTSANSR
ncbi:hypothetical protein GALMADRAFT_1171866 [Galerina marginata CBS 339.88]|uniref:RRM domain-containing protein n=1 Tax=Galerina marginata (strain CBS 339.88) TaxID=685588 RepID=A0A067TJA4_GALM3|nr:hypothetical protein GALMADRAFT_1171866 [Galerina marginata CBS 339.88]